MFGHDWLDFLPHTRLGLTGWVIQCSYLVVGIGVFLSFMVLPGLEWVSPIGWGRDFGSSGTPTWKMVAGWNGAFSEV